MTADSLESRTSLSEGLPVVRYASTFWGLAAIVLLAVFTLVSTITQTPGATTQRSNAAARTQPVEQQQHVSPFAGFVAPPAPPIERLAPVLYLTCGPDDLLGRGGGGTPGRYPITMRLDQVPDDIRSILNGTDTVFPKDAPIVKTACIQQKIASGELP